jgi:hypothetical protein
VYDKADVTAYSLCSAATSQSGRSWQPALGTGLQVGFRVLLAKSGHPAMRRGKRILSERGSETSFRSPAVAPTVHRFVGHCETQGALEPR